MADSSSSIGWNVKADQPYATETQAAADLANPDRKSYMALPTLIGQQAQHSIDNSNYAEQLGYQRQFAYQQAQDKIREWNAKNAIDIMRLGNDNPGAIGLAANNPVTAGSFAGMDPQMAGAFNDWSARSNTAKIVDLLGKGAQGALAGGIQMPTDYFSQVLPGNPALQYGDPPLVAAKKIGEAGANARHAAGGGVTITATDPGTGAPPQIVYKGSPAAVAPYIKSAPPTTPSSTRSDAPNVGSTGQTTTTATTPQRSDAQIPRLAPADKATAAEGTAIIQRRVGQISGPAKADIAGSKDFRRAPNGDIYVIGKSGNPYRLNQ